MRFAFVSLITLVTAVAAAAYPPSKLPLSSRGTKGKLPFNPRTNGLPFNPPLGSRPVGRAIVEARAAPQAGAMTNGKRFAAGLPPLKPRAQPNPRQGTPRRSALRPRSSPLPPVDVKCRLLVKNAETGDLFGYIAPTWNSYGQYGLVQSDATGSLEISFSYSPGSSGSPSHLNLAAVNGPSGQYPFFGATVGYISPDNDLTAGNFNYAAITGTTQIPAGPAVDADNNSFSSITGIPKNALSAIWSYDPQTHAITAQWINSDGSAAPVSIVYVNDYNQAFALTGDVGVLQSAYGFAYPPVTFTCEPA